MKSPSILVFACLGSAWAQTPAPPPATLFPSLPDQTVVAVFDDGVKFTLGSSRASIRRCRPPCKLP